MVNTSKNSNRILRRPELQSLFGLAKGTVRNRIINGLLPPPIDLGGRAVGWVESECLAVLDAMIAEKPPEAIKALVNELISNRTVNNGGL